MLDTLKAGSAYEAAIGTPPKRLDSLSETAQRLYLALKLAAEKVKESRGYHPNTSQVTLFCPVEAVALAIGVSRQTVYNHLPALAELGLVAQLGHYCTYRGATRSDGSLWSVRLNPETPGRAKVEHDWLKKSYRDLGSDIQKGKTAWSLLQSKPVRAKSVEIDYILSFAIIPTDTEPIKDDCKDETVSGLETLLDVPYAPATARNSAVDNAARAVSVSLGSPASSFMFWRWLIWQLLRLEQENQSYFYQVFLILQRAKVEREENACRNAAGLAVSRLKQSPIWDELRSVPPIRIGNKPKSVP